MYAIRSYYENSVLHGGNFDAEAARLLTKIDEGHQAIVYSDAERQAIITWINAEKALNNGSFEGREEWDTCFAILFLMQAGRAIKNMPYNRATKVA